MRAIAVKPRRESRKKMIVLAINQEKATIKVFIGIADAAKHFQVAYWKIAEVIKTKAPLEFGGFQYRFEKDKS